MGEIAAVEAHHVDAHITDGLSCGFYIRWYVLADRTLSANVGMLPDAGELLYPAQATDDSEITYFHMACQLYAVGQDYMIANNTIVGHVGISHQQAVRSDNRFPF